MGMGCIEENVYKDLLFLKKKNNKKFDIFFWFAELLPYVEGAGPETREFLLKVIDILLDFVKTSNDRTEKVCFSQ